MVSSVYCDAVHMKLLNITFIFFLILLFFTNIVNAVPDPEELLNPELTDTGNIEQGEIELIDPVWETGTVAKVCIYLAGYSGEITIEDEHYIPKMPSECADVIIKTKSLAKRPLRQEYTTYLTDNEDGDLDVKVKVISYYLVKKYKTVLGIRIPYYATAYTTEWFYKIFDAPQVFPAFEAPKAWVTYYNGSHAIVNVAYVDEEGNELDGIGKVDIKVPGSAAREYRLIGEIGTAANGFRSTNFQKISTWKYSGKQISRSQSGVWIGEPFDIDNLTITVSTPYLKNVPVTDIEYTVVEDTSRKFLRLDFLALIVTTVLYCRPFYLRLNKEVEKWKLRY